MIAARPIRLRPLLIALAVLPLVSCTDEELTKKAYSIIAALGGRSWEPSNGTPKACPDFQGANHWGVFYPPGYYHPGVADYTVCFTGGLARDTLLHGTVGLHESGHLYFQRLREHRLSDVQPRSVEEHYADCFAKIFFGVPAGLYYGCSSGEEQVVRDLLARWPETGGW